MDNSGPYQALYLHLPFCRQRCLYCDFATQAASVDDPALDEYVESLVREVREASRNGVLRSIRTIYLGGGTPSHLGLRRLVTLVYTLSLSINLDAQTEFTCEANPESLTAAMVRDLFALGVNRFSLGVQSLVDSELAALGRVHDAAQALAAVAAVRERTDNVSVDLMCGVPGQTLESFAHSVRGVLDSGVGHLSVYPLTIEAGTPYASMIASGVLQLPDEDLQAQMLELAAALAADAGLQRYEVASYARPGLECRHNTAYWTGVPYLGLGAGAASMRNLDDGGRERRAADGTVEHLSASQACAEDIMLGMRMSRGVPIAQVEAAAGLLPGLAAVFAKLCKQGLVQRTATHYRPSQQGWLLGNLVFEEVLLA
jgi:oxygen-independent coproporphyrinogen-3 oxidase